MQLVAKRRLPYGIPPRVYRAGETFTATAAHGKLLIKLGLASESIPAEFVEQPEEPPREAPKKRTYKRRDLQAEE